MDDSKKKKIVSGGSPLPQHGFHIFQVMGLKLIFFFLRFYLFIHDRHRDRGEGEAETQAEREAGPMQEARRWDSIPGPKDHTLGQRQQWP